MQGHGGDDGVALYFQLYGVPGWEIIIFVRLDCRRNERIGWDYRSGRGTGIADR